MKVNVKNHSSVRITFLCLHNFLVIFKNDSVVMELGNMIVIYIFLFIIILSCSILHYTLFYPPLFNCIVLHMLISGVVFSKPLFQLHTTVILHLLFSYHHDRPFYEIRNFYFVSLFLNLVYRNNMIPAPFIYICTFEQVKLYISHSRFYQNHVNLTYYHI